MTDDIVTRLREHASQIRCVVGVNTSVVVPMLELEAANEIERVRDELAYWRDMAITLGDYMANVPQPILDAYSAIWQVKYANRSRSDG